MLAYGGNMEGDKNHQAYIDWPKYRVILEACKPLHK